MGFNVTKGVHFLNYTQFLSKLDKKEMIWSHRGEGGGGVEYPNPLWLDHCYYQIIDTTQTCVCVMQLFLKAVKR